MRDTRLHRGRDLFVRDLVSVWPLGVLYPIIALHLVLLPLDGYRLWQGLRRAASD